MINNVYSKAYVEVLEIISHFSEEDYKKIPKEKIKFYEDNKDKNYQFTINPKIDLDKQNISKEAGAIIINLYRDYFATEEQKVKIEEILQLNQQKTEIEKRNKYNPDNLFKNNSKETQKSAAKEVALVEYKEDFFTKFKNFIKKLLHLKN